MTESCREKKSPLYTTVTDHYVLLDHLFICTCRKCIPVTPQKNQSMWNWLTNQNFRRVSALKWTSKWQSFGKIRSPFTHEFASITSRSCGCIARNTRQKGKGGRHQRQLKCTVTHSHRLIQSQDSKKGQGETWETGHLVAVKRLHARTQMQVQCRLMRFSLAVVELFYLEATNGAREQGGGTRGDAPSSNYLMATSGKGQMRGAPTNHGWWCMLSR